MVGNGQRLTLPNPLDHRAIEWCLFASFGGLGGGIATQQQAGGQAQSGQKCMAETHGEIL